MRSNYANVRYQRFHLKPVAVSRSIERPIDFTGLSFSIKSVARSIDRPFDFFDRFNRLGPVLLESAHRVTGRRLRVSNLDELEQFDNWIRAITGLQRSRVRTRDRRVTSARRGEQRGETPKTRRRIREYQRVEEIDTHRIVNTNALPRTLVSPSKEISRAGDEHANERRFVEFTFL